MKLIAESIEKWYIRKSGSSNRFFAVQKTDLALQEGKVTMLTGRSGSGKTTLMHILGGLLVPDRGRVLADGEDLYARPDPDLSRFRNERIGMIPQGYSAIKSLNVLENVLLPLRMYGAGRPGDEEEAARLLERFGIGQLAEAFPRELSGGELRRLAISRALLGHPPVLLADEPTGDLDDENTRLVLESLREEADRGAAVLLVTHENDAAAYADIVLRMSEGSLKSTDGGQLLRKDREKTDEDKRSKRW